jgi:hypothetical protein
MSAILVSAVVGACVLGSSQVHAYEDVGTVKLGDYFTLDPAWRELRGDFRKAPRMYFWNTWLAK